MKGQILDVSSSLDDLEERSSGLELLDAFREVFFEAEYFLEKVHEYDYNSK